MTKIKGISSRLCCLQLRVALKGEFIGGDQTESSLKKGNRKGNPFGNRITLIKRLQGTRGTDLKPGETRAVGMGSQILLLCDFVVPTGIRYAPPHPVGNPQ